ncbi:MAG: DUF433 domain-containing protein [Cyanobacteria bacterium P01_E01_bin.42]
MSLVEKTELGIIRTERGLTIAGTRITIYQILDYIHANYPRESIRNLFSITDEQFAEAMLYIKTHRQAVEEEYKIVLQQAEEIRKYWDKQNQEHLARVAQSPSKAEHQAVWEKLQQRKHKQTRLS